VPPTRPFPSRVCIMSVERPNTHPIWDPDWAAGGVQERYQPQIALGKELVHYGADLLMRALQSAPDDVPNHVILAVLFRQALAAFDATMVGLESAAMASANIHARGQMEARWGLKLALADSRRWGRHLYVASLRQQRIWAARLIPGTTEYQQYSEARTVIESAPPTPARKDPVPDWPAYVAGVDRLLARDEYSEIARHFAEFAAERGFDPPWFYDGSLPKGDRLQSFRQLAIHVGCRAEYDTIYKHASYYVHGAFTGTSLSYDERGVAVAPLRTPEGWRQLYLLSVSMATEAYRQIIDRYREAEVAAFARNYNERWRAVIQATPEVEVVLTRMVNA
jgi:uncharacterized protein DUF5677